MAEGRSALEDLPPYLLHKILTKSRLMAVDLASFESSCYTFRAAQGFLPWRYKSVPEIAAFDLCKVEPTYSRMPHQHRSQLLQRCGGNWKLALRFLQTVKQAHGCVATPKGNIQVAAGNYHTLIVYGNGELFYCGWGLTSAQANDSDNPLYCKTLIPVDVPKGLPVIHVAASHKHIAFVTRNGEVFTYGDNLSYCCGHGDAEQTIMKPTIVAALKGIPCKQVATGQSFTVVLTREGHVYTCGANAHGQLGHGDAVEKLVPTKVERLSSGCPVVQVSAGANYTLAVTQDGAVYSCGYAGNFCLGHGDRASELQPRLIQKFQEHNCFILNVAAAQEHSVAMDANGQVYTWGKGYCGALGQGDEDDLPTPNLVASLSHIRAVQVCANKRKTFVLSDDGLLFSFGWMAFGSLGLTARGESEKVLSPNVVESLKSHHISQVSTGFYHTVVITSKGIVLGIGDNARSQLGLLHFSSCSEPVEMSLGDSCTQSLVSLEGVGA